jgi:hypothetical protein
MELKEKIESALSQIRFDNKTKSFVGTTRFLKELKLLGFNYRDESHDLIYGSDSDRPFQDYDGISLLIFLEKGGEHLQLYLAHYNGTKNISAVLSDSADQKIIDFYWNF